MGEPLLHTDEQQPTAEETQALDIIDLRSPEGPMYSRVRPHASRLVESLAGEAELVLWTAGMRDYARACMEEIDPKGRIAHSIYRDRRWFDMSYYVKHLDRLGRSMDRTLIVDNSDYVCRDNADYAIIVDDFYGPPDDLLLLVEDLLKGLIASGKPVPEYLKECGTDGRLVFVDGFYRIYDWGKLGTLPSHKDE